MKSLNVEGYDYFIEVDRMINEGLGGGYIDTEYKEKQLETIDMSKFSRKTSVKNHTDKG